MFLDIAIQDLVLVDLARVPFKPGLNIISGETGAGKSALLNGLKLISGEKGGSDWIRHGAQKAIVEVRFIAPHLNELLGELGIATDEVLTIRREVSLNGKSRNFINDELCTLATLKQVTQELIDIASQHATTKLLDIGFHRETLDLFADQAESVKAFSRSFDRERSLREKLDNLISSSQKRHREIETLGREIEEIDDAKLKPQEEEALFTEYEALSTAQDRIQKTEEAINFIPNFMKLKSLLEELSSRDPALQDLAKTLKSSIIELEEGKFELERYLNRIDSSPEKLSNLEARLKEISALKKRYGNTVEMILAYREEAAKKLESWESLDEEIETLKKEIELLHKENRNTAEKISSKRHKSVKLFENAMRLELEQLNLPDAKFEVELIPVEMKRTGLEDVSFFFTPNKGGKRIEVSEGASGGELNRLLLAIKSTLAGKEGTSVLVFDEIDSNIGGATALKVGERLKALGRTSQVISITHFPQVAKFADHHLRVQKRETEGVAKTFIEVLSDAEKSFELNRMSGCL